MNDIVSPDLKLRIESVVLDCLLKGQQYFGTSKISFIPDIRYVTKGRAAGRAHWMTNGRHWIDINPILLNENVEYVVNQTVPHEVAHLLTYAVHGTRVKPHGREWKQMMYSLGKRPNRCHSLDTTTVTKRRSVTKVEYICGCGEKLLLTRNRVTKMRNGKTYRHIRCGASVTYDKLMNFPY